MFCSVPSQILLTYSIFYGFNIRRFAVTALILMVLAGSISGSMLPFFLIITFLSMVLSGIYVFIRKISLIELLKREISIVTLMLIATMFAFVPLYFSAVYSTPSSYSTGFVLEYFKSESSTTTLLNVLTMLGYNQVGPGSLSYPWIGSLPLISIFALFLIIMVFLRIIVKGIEKSTVLLVIVAFLTVFFSTGSNPPFGYINERLVLLKGPFLFLINSYYFTMQYYVLFICVMLFDMEVS